MSEVALIFPGQGAQYVEMGKAFYETSEEAKKIFDQADQILGNGLKDVIFNGPAEKLTTTAFCQPAILTMSVAALMALKDSSDFQDNSPKFTAGLSLGEYGALVASGALSFEETLKLVQKRSRFMEEATKQQAGKMAAIIGLDKTSIIKICQETGAEVANFNSLQQIVITGHADKVEAACLLLKEAGARNVVMLDVSGAFHSTLMQPAADKFKQTLAEVNFQVPQIPIISNVDAQPTSDPEVIRANLSKQITSSVLWVDTIQYIAQQGIIDFIEIGPGSVLKGLIRRIDRTLKVKNIEKPEYI